MRKQKTLFGHRILTLSAMARYKPVDRHACLPNVQFISLSGDSQPSDQ